MSEQLIAPPFLFHISTRCLPFAGKWTAKGFDMGPEYAIPSFHAELNDGPHYADFRLGWSDAGLFLFLRTTEKKQSPWCRATRLEDSDGMALWIDTRNTQNIHRASRFCHQFIFLPQGAGQLLEQPVGKLVSINRAKEHPKAVGEGVIKVRSEKRVDGYILHGFIPASAVTGFDPAEHRLLGFTYAIIDREHGWQTFSLGPEYPFASDPSLWGTLELVK